MARGKKRPKDRHGPGRMDDGDGGGATWLTTYADAITLLMAFFMMLYAMSQIDQAKFEALIAGFAVPFGNEAYGQSSGRDALLDAGLGIVGSAATSDPTASVDSQFQDIATRDPVETKLQAAVTSTSGEGETDSDGLPIIGYEQLREVRDAIAIEFERLDMSDAVEFELDVRGLVVSIAADDILFASGSVELQESGREVMSRLVPVLMEFGNRIVIEGHTDDTPLNRGGYTNWNLSTDRAVAVLSSLIDDFDMNPSRMGAAGYGEFRPRLPNDSPENRAKNRRVEVVILAGGTR